jgi:hypothetical protein
MNIQNDAALMAINSRRDEIIGADRKQIDHSQRVRDRTGILLSGPLRLVEGTVTVSTGRM